MTNIDKAKKIARRWRKFHPEHKGGFVVICELSVAGWTLSLDVSDRWVPGCISVGENESCFRAVGGDSRRGATGWMEITQPAPALTP